MGNNKEKHQIAFCVSAVTFLAGLSLIATAIAVGTVPAIAACLVIGGILTVLSGVQAVESYLFLRNSEKILNKLISIALFTIIRTDRNMLLACYSHKHISYRIRTIIRKAIIYAMNQKANFL